MERRGEKKKVAVVGPYPSNGKMVFSHAILMVDGWTNIRSKWGLNLKLWLGKEWKILKSQERNQ